jgi:hypothetical protein
MHTESLATKLCNAEIVKFIAAEMLKATRIRMVSCCGDGEVEEW